MIFIAMENHLLAMPGHYLQVPVIRVQVRKREGGIISPEKKFNAKTLPNLIKMLKSLIRLG